MSGEIYKKKARQIRERKQMLKKLMSEAHFGKAASIHHRRKGTRGIVIGVQKNRGGVYINPALQVAFRIKSAFKAPLMSYVTVKDGEGNLRHYLDPLTRKKVSIEEMEQIKSQGVNPQKIPQVKP